jgi:Fur family peroxide stress response transcriptional regulator
MNNYTNALREHHLKATPQRLEIANTLERYGHINIDKLYEIMLQKFNSISLATIYKNINLMLENSFIQEVKIPHEKSVYELAQETHSHLVCKECGAIEDIFIDLTEVANEVPKEARFEIEKVDVVFSGVCQKCQAL